MERERAGRREGGRGEMESDGERERKRHTKKDRQTCERAHRPSNWAQTFLP